MYCSQQIINVMRGEVSNSNKSKINNDSGNLKGKCVETRTTLISGRWRSFKERTVNNIMNLLSLVFYQGLL